MNRPTLAVVLLILVFFAALDVASAGSETLLTEAPDEAFIIEVQSGGTGCPDGTVQAEFTPDQKKVSVFFDDYVVNSEDSEKGRLSRKCRLGISVHVPQGFSFALADIEYRGAVFVPYKGRALFEVSYFFRGRDLQISQKKVWKNLNIDDEAIDEDFLLESSIPLKSHIWSRCGKNEILRVNTLAGVKRGLDDETEIAIDTLDAEISLIANFRWKTCSVDEEGNENGNRNGYGNGAGSGNRYGNRYGNGYGNGNGNGNGYRRGNGHGNGCEQGNGDENEGDSDSDSDSDSGTDNDYEESENDESEYDNGGLEDNENDDENESDDENDNG